MTDPEQPAARSQSTPLAALGALTEELVNTRETIANLPTRSDIEKRISVETGARRRGQRQIMAMITLVGLGVGLSLWNVQSTKDIAHDVRDIAEANQRLNAANLEIVAKIDCVVGAASRLTGEPLQLEYARCLDAAEKTVADRFAKEPK